MSGEVKEKAGKWANIAYKIFMTVSAGLILKCVTAIYVLTGAFYAEFKQLQHDRDLLVQAQILQRGVDSAQNVKIAHLDSCNVEFAATLNAQGEKLIELAFK